jgi:hypothetical protein
MRRRTQWFYWPKLSTNFRIGSGKAKSAIPIIPTTAAMTFGADSSLPLLALKEIRSIAHNPYGSPQRILHEKQRLECHLSQPPACKIETKIVVQRKEPHRPVRATKPGNCRNDRELPVFPVPFIGCANSALLVLPLELLHECSEMPRGRSRNGIVLVPQSFPDCCERNESLASRIDVPFGRTRNKMPTYPVVDLVGWGG